MSGAENRSIPPRSASSVDSNWFIAGIVISEPSIGQIKAIIPSCNVYSDIRIEDFISFDARADATRPAPATFTTKTSDAKLKQSEGDSLTGKEDAQKASEAVITSHHQSRRRTIVKSLFDFDLHDLAVMVGAGSFIGSVASVCWGFISSSPMPPSLSLILADRKSVV